jgi:hypothetical protein
LETTMVFPQVHFCVESVVRSDSLNVHFFPAFAHVGAAG